ncbi:penicillin-binding protein 1C [Thalassobius vesicularis]|uniref:peptidoglycan glycosyltransferase n=1 Tax=Thalassobius vesicularis TaxID=1294297 RepID=A0A4S3MES5_9RHOB|nr:penicillin-binding protein 1C [Thalassobius vesicularis]THD76648.1 penicillin-binding protein 1C [Thalassobius vesicularis]
MTRLAPFALVLALWAGAAARDAVDDWVARTDLPVTVVEHSTEVRDRNGILLRAYTVADGRWRLPVSADQVDPRFIRMLLAYEDGRFYDHSGVDALALLRATGQAVLNGRVVSGGSTLTMQVARLLENGPTGQWRGKLRQLRVALALERHLTKAQILNLYLSLAPYGGNIEGIRAATLAWFGKEPTRLTPAEAALLVALPQAPEARRPDRPGNSAADARERVLQRMQEAGVLTAENLQAARLDPVPTARQPFPSLAPHVADRMISAAPDRQRHDLTLDSILQSQLEALATDALRGKRGELSIALLAARIEDGEILASVGSAGYAPGQGQGFIDMTTALRSPGSTLKPLVYAMAFDQGLAHPETLIDDRPVSFGRYAPQNFDGQFRGQIKVADALRQSLNIPVVLLTDQLGPLRLMSALRQSGAQPVIPGGKPGLAVALGGVGVTLRDLVQLYAGLANGGQAVALHETGAAQPGARFVSRSAAWQVGYILSGMTPPPGAPANRLAYKTGTSYGHRDAWAIGFDGTHVIGVWIGRPDGTPVPGAFGGDVAAPVLFEAFQRLKPQLDPLPPPPPETLLVTASLLPQPLRRFRGRDAAFLPDADAPKLAFPPDGARLPLDSHGLVVKLRDGRPPFTLLANGQPILTGGRDREVMLPAMGKGFVTLSVIDAQGRSDRVNIRVD